MSARYASEVSAEEREGDEKINHDESHDTIDGAYREVVQGSSLSNPPCTDAKMHISFKINAHINNSTTIKDA